ncbi:MAG: DUF2007 domain-containing protein [Nitrospirota bacterium]|nr:DUF2007 domain-containing protein [Nitrospirota bacterium]
MINLYSPQDEAELALLRSILDSENINYCVKNDIFGSLKIGPRIALYNVKMIEVQDDQYAWAKDLLSDYFEKTTADNVEHDIYSWSDKVRMVIEVLLMGWIVLGRRNSKGID